ncbi:hypothetical protein FHS18_000679 [Paenibacillus phyllosphaerae]|uniref:Uncharacterized protein n=1 Tax=Paenibacillus phyllosphaerae TaxID=274593 RepID=A0A7W5AUY9_9BACL|nr:hypothetical protein [Paenibacillus phyllosphaerae]MBB3108651.1 hypothetical protein [Paenibacillus phyllosphaerae]
MAAIIRIVMCCALSAVSVLLNVAAASGSAEPIRISIQTSPKAVPATELPLPSADWKKAFEHAAETKGSGPPVTDMVVLQGEHRYAVNGDYQLYDAQQGTLITLPADYRRMLRGYMAWLRSVHYGELLTWPQAKQVLTMKSRFTVHDLETGLRFHVQRRAGSTHADVQPLTKQDTRIMKQIYSGKWTWKRRAIVVEKDGHTIAASMHGMPHGGDGIPDNDFDGHFCIHFLGSSTHKTATVDPDHQTMVHKAAGELYRYADRSSAANVIALFFIAINQQDPEVMSALFQVRNHPGLQAALAELGQITAIKRVTDLPDEADDGMLVRNIEARAVVYRLEKRKEERTFVFQLRRSGPWQPWKIEAVESK